MTVLRPAKASHGCVHLEQPFGAILQQLKAVVAGHIPEDGKRLPKLSWRLGSDQCAAALITVPAQVATQHLRNIIKFTSKASHAF